MNTPQSKKHDAGSADERDAYDQLQCYTLAHGGAAFIHQHVVDVWAAQHANESTKPIGLIFALVGLYLRVEKRYTGRHVQNVHMALARKKLEFPPISLPTDRGSMTAIDVMTASEGPERDRSIDQWCASVWAAYQVSHHTVIEFLQQHDIV